MLRYTLRRALWAVPTLFGVSFVVFLLTTLLPDPAALLTREELRTLRADPPRFMRLEERRRQLFLDLPRVVNVRPQDVRQRVEQALEHLHANDEEAPVAVATLVRIGGAGLPYLLPRLDQLGSDERRRIAMALMPLASRMGIDVAMEPGPDGPVRFWARFWNDRQTDFTAPAVKRNVDRLASRSTEARERELAMVDTFALQELVLAMPRTRDPSALARLTRIASRAAGREGALREDATREEIDAIVADWQSWWFIHESDFVVRDGLERTIASLGDTRYAKWMLGAATGKLGLSSRDKLPLFAKVRDRAPVTLGMTFLAMLLAFTIAVPVGALSAWRRGQAVNRVIAVTLFTAYSLPTFWVAQVLYTFAQARGVAGVSIPVLALATTAIATLSRHQRASMLEVIAQDYIRTARAKGVPGFRVAVVHALRNAILPTIALAGLQFPALLGGAFAIEEVFGIQGMGWETLRAIEAHDTAWIVAMVLLSALVTTAMLIASDVAQGLLDPRIRERQLGRRSGH